MIKSDQITDQINHCPEKVTINIVIITHVRHYSLWANLLLNYLLSAVVAVLQFQLKMMTECLKFSVV